MEGVQDEATSYLWYVRSLACSPSMHDKVFGDQIMSIVWAESDITVVALIKVVHGLTTYQVRYGEA
jgi:hypothetical protein